MPRDSKCQVDWAFSLLKRHRQGQDRQVQGAHAKSGNRFPLFQNGTGKGRGGAMPLYSDQLFIKFPLTFSDFQKLTNHKITMFFSYLPDIFFEK